MKNNLLPYLFFLALTSCIINHKDGDGEVFSVTIDTINIHLRDSMGPAVRIDLTHAIKYKDHYYTLFERNELYSYSPYDKDFFIISEEGDIQRLPLPNKISGYYFDLFVKNDSIIFMDYIDPDTYYLDIEALQWISIPEADDVIYQDDRYYITSRDFGEFGFLTWFRNKATGQEYELGAFTTLVNKVDSSYYITSPYRMLRIDDPTQLIPTTSERSYTYIKTKRRMYETYTQLQGAEIIYKDTTYSDNDLDWDFEKKTPHVSIITSFVHNERLFHLCQDSASIYVAQLDSGILAPIQYIDESHTFLNWHNSYRMKIKDDGSQLLKFQTEDPNLFGLIEICENKIDIRYLRHDIDSIPYLGKEAFPAIFCYFYNNPDLLHLNTLCEIEKENGATKLQSPSHWGLHKDYYPNLKGYDIKRAEDFLRTQDGKISCISRYYYTKEDSIVRAALLTWTKTKPYNRQQSYYWYDDPVRNELFQKKVDELTQYLTVTLNSSPNIKKEKAYHTFYTVSWKKDNGLKIDLHYTNDFITGQEICLVMYY